MEFRNVVIRSKTVLSVECHIDIPIGEHVDEVSPEYLILPEDVAKIQVRVVGAHTTSGEAFSLVFVKLFKCRPNDEHTYSMRLTEPMLHKVIPCCELFQLVLKGSGSRRVIPMTLRVEAQTPKSEPAPAPPLVPFSFATLHDDSELTDFELRGSDGGVKIHRTALAVASPVLRRMLAGEWRETAQGHVDVPDVSSATLRHLKDYIYINLLPESGLEQLLLLASRYMMYDLEKQCSRHLVDGMSAENATDLIEFATRHQFTSLLIDLLEGVQMGKLNIKEMRKHNKCTQ